MISTCLILRLGLTTSNAIFSSQVNFLYYLEFLTLDIIERKITIFCFRFKKCKEEGMIYNNCDDSKVQISRELFEARQRQLTDIRCNKKQSSKYFLKAKTRMELDIKIRNRSKTVSSSHVRILKIQQAIRSRFSVTA